MSVNRASPQVGVRETGPDFASFTTGPYLTQGGAALTRKLLSLAAASAVALGLLVTLGAVSAGAAAGGGCQLAGTASFNPGLSNTAGNFNYSFGGNLTNCHASDPNAPATGTVSAGQVVTGAAGEQFQEPVPSGNGTCANGTTSGTSIISWADGTATVIAYTTTSAGAAVDLTGQVVPSVTLAAINPAPGQPTSETISSTRFSAFSAFAPLAFQADPTQCNTAAGVSSAGISGLATLSSVP
jgi:hypothetical protein